MSTATNPLTVLMPAYNAGPYVAQAIASVQAQTVRDFELIVIDDGSKDDTLAVVRKCAEGDSRIRVVTQPNAGLCPTMNRGLEMARGEWVFCMHADDLMMPNRLERQLAFLQQNPDLAVASSLVYYINDKDETVGRGRSPLTCREAVQRVVNAGDPVSFNHPASVMRKSVVQAVGGYRQEFWPAEDCDLWNRVVQHGHRVLVQDEFLLKYRIHASSASISRNRLMQQKAIWIEACIRSRRNGTPEPSWDGFLAARRAAPMWRWLNEVRNELGRAFYQSSLHYVSTRQYRRFVTTLLAATALEPELVLSRVLPRLLPWPAR